MKKQSSIPRIEVDAEGLMILVTWDLCFEAGLAEPNVSKEKKVPSSSSVESYC